MPLINIVIVYIYIIFIQLPQNGNLLSTFRINQGSILRVSGTINEFFAKYKKRSGCWEGFLQELEIQIQLTLIKGPTHPLPPNLL